jgi:acyl-homoserine lactone acylase PvdQ
MLHSFSPHPFFGALFTVGPMRVGGDANTLAQASVDPLDSAGNPLFVASTRMTVDVGAWENRRFALTSGQSGNPLSPHFADRCA